MIRSLLLHHSCVGVGVELGAFATPVDGALVVVLPFDQVEKTIRERIKRLQNGLAESAIPQVGVAAAEMSSANDREKLDMREEYVSALREARTAGGFRKLVKMLENDRKMKAIDVKSIAHELLDRKFPSKKAAIAALATSGAPVSRERHAPPHPTQPYQQATHTRQLLSDCNTMLYGARHKEPRQELRRHGHADRH